MEDRQERHGLCAQVYFSRSCLQIANDKVRKTAIFNPERLAAFASVQKINRRRNRRADRRKYLSVLVQGGRKEIAVTAPVVSQKLADLRQAVIDVATPEQEFGRSE